MGKAVSAVTHRGDAVEEQITAVDSKGGKVQISSVTDGNVAATTVASTKGSLPFSFLSPLKLQKQCCPPDQRVEV